LLFQLLSIILDGEDLFHNVEEHSMQLGLLQLVNLNLNDFDQHGEDYAHTSRMDHLTSKTLEYWCDMLRKFIFDLKLFE
jgi:hypothetical protein